MTVGISSVTLGKILSLQKNLMETVQFVCMGLINIVLLLSRVPVGHVAFRNLYYLLFMIQQDFVQRK